MQVSIAFRRRHVVEFCLGLYRSRTGKYKLGRSQLPRRVREFLVKMFEQGHLTESMVTRYGFGAWLRQECAFGNAFFEDTHGAFTALCRKQIFGDNTI